ncbi:MAG: PAS domain-containing protein [Alphaproteobacteria bacterium]
MDSSYGDQRASGGPVGAPRPGSAAPSVADGAAQRKSWRVWAPGAGFAAAALLVFFALRADGVAEAGPVALIILLLGVVSIAALYRAERRAAAEAEARIAAQAAVAEARRRADALDDACARLSDLVDNLPLGFYSADAEGRLRYVNRTLADWLGRDPADVMASGARVADLFDREGGDEEAVAAPAIPGEIAELEIALRRQAGDSLPAFLSQNIGHGAGGASYTRSVLSEVAARRESRAVLHQAEQRSARFFESAPIGIALVDLDGVVVDCNRMFRAMAGETGADPVGRRLVEMIDAGDHADLEARLKAAAGRTRGLAPLEVRLNLPHESSASLYASPLEDVGGDVTGVILHLIDTTEQKDLERQFFQSQKMQAVGQLAGGIAHDFNNLLTAMMGFCDLLLMRHRAGDQSFADIMQIKQNVNRAAGLVRQLLAFSRRQTLQPRVLVLTDVLAELTNLLRRLIGENIELKMVHARDLGQVKADQGQIEQVIINLAVNARDAMPDGGALTIRTANVSESESVKFGHELLPAGEYVLIEVADAGVGIPKEHLGKIFDPFFSTKEVGAGTGLGLSTVYGIVKQTGGYVFVDSAPDAGATFRVFLPRHRADEAETAEDRAAAPPEPARDLTGKGTILLVEDEDSVRVFGSRALRGKGYTVLEADSGEAALDVIGSYDGTIDLLVTDVVMPQMDGTTLVETVRENRPDLRVIFISGYAEEAFGEKLDKARDVGFLPKPFSLAQLAGKVKEALDAPAG